MKYVISFLILMALSGFVRAEYGMMTSGNWYDACTPYIESKNENDFCKVLTATAINHFYSGYVLALHRAFQPTSGADLNKLKPFCINPTVEIDLYIKEIYGFISGNPQKKQVIFSDPLFTVMSRNHPCT